MNAVEDDVAAAAYIYQQAQKNNAGAWVEF
jgi:ornithine cyclodeaminase/alanine dehydrogenase-like protein (mu-crystallin family)